MSELISELHALAQRMAAAGETDEPVTVSLAAEEIERLQQQNDYLSSLASGQPLYGLEEKIANLMARNKALREEVERLREYTTAQAELEAKNQFFIEELEQERNQLKDRLKKLNSAATAVIDSRAALGLDSNRYSVDMNLLIELSHCRPAQQSKESSDELEGDQCQ